jgi:hypothetical protein
MCVHAHVRVIGCVWVFKVTMHGMNNNKFEKVLLVSPDIRQINKTCVKNFSGEQLLEHTV